MKRRDGGAFSSFSRPVGAGRVCHSGDSNPVPSLAKGTPDCSGRRGDVISITRGALAIAACAVTLTACATQPAPEGKVQTVEVKVEVPVSCVPADRPAKPDFTDTREAILSAPNFAVRDQLIKSEWMRHQAWEKLEDAIVDSCAKAAPPPMPK